MSWPQLLVWPHQYSFCSSITSPVLSTSLRHGLTCEIKLLTFIQRIIFTYIWKSKLLMPSICKSPKHIWTYKLHGQTDQLLFLCRFDPDGFQCCPLRWLESIIDYIFHSGWKKPAQNLIKQNNWRRLHWRAFKDLLITLMIFYDLVSQIIKLNLNMCCQFNLERTENIWWLSSKRFRSVQK